MVSQSLADMDSDVEIDPEDNSGSSSSDDYDSSSSDDSESEDEDHQMTVEEIDRRLGRLRAQHRQQQEQVRRQSAIAPLFDSSSSDDSDISSSDDSESEDENHPVTAEAIDRRLRRPQAQLRQQREEQAGRQSTIASAQLRTQSQRTNTLMRAPAVRIQKKVNARLRFQQESEKTRLDEIRKQAAERKRQEELSIATVQGISKQCPGCSWPIQKRSGCDHMTCESSQPSAIRWQLPSFMPTANPPLLLYPCVTNAYQ